MKKIHLVLMLAVLAMGFAACKYEEGPFISVIPKVERVANTWVVSEANINGTSKSSIDGFKKINLFKEGACQIFYINGTTESASSGVWSFSDDKTSIHIDVKDEATGMISYVNDWTILHLKEDQLKVSYFETNGSGSKDTYIVTFEPAS